ncbi:LOW QUALITY PROTEIN: coiled-coil domain-containing protein 69 [Hippocampus zosterae]|uniref:LOW QUALITY PROTEIN: coiled-coil domain-containing protein 69 n=1 Tax=Hippocampus zosterae TaxID=109293 RepID=UPI00223D88CC|nr:LOW QUALITY PROTEIN: coiled-coil domain-containing protein 69 [Hippocampus zosterae]
MRGVNAPQGSRSSPHAASLNASHVKPGGGAFSNFAEARPNFSAFSRRRTTEQRVPKRRRRGRATRRATRGEAASAGMGCRHSKKKSKKDDKDNSRQDGAKRAHSERRGGGLANANAAAALEKHLERLEWQLMILKEVLSANGGAERAELLKEHADEEVCTLVLALLDKVKTETCAQLSAVHQQQRQQTAQQHQQHLHEVERAHEEVKVQLTEKFQISENLLKVEVSHLKTELERYNELKKRVQESTFKKDLLRNIQAHGSPGAFWESEQESLLFVIEMKSERLREQNRKLQDMEQLVEEKLCAEDHLVQTLQQNEDLRVRLDKSQSVLQHTCREREEARASLERQRLFNETLTREKEQLLFKLNHRDACPILNMAAAAIAPS